jgi:hypothetical protein
VLGYKEEEDEEGEGRETGTQFTDVDLTELEWADYDEKSGLSTVISGSKKFSTSALNTRAENKIGRVGGGEGIHGKQCL